MQNDRNPKTATLPFVVIFVFILVMVGLYYDWRQGGEFAGQVEDFVTEQTRN